MAGAAEGYWLDQSMLAIMERTYDRVTPVGGENNGRFFEVELNGITFLAILVHAEGAPEKIVQFGFLSYFTGFDLSVTGVEALNRNLHISVAEIDEHNNLILFSMMEIRGVFDANRFGLVLEAWHRDLVMTIKMILPGASVSNELSPRLADLMRRRAANHFDPGSQSMAVGDPIQAEPSVEAKRVVPNRDAPQAAFSGQGADDAVANLRSGPRPSPQAAIIRPSTAPSDRGSKLSPEDLSRAFSRFLGTADQARALCTQCEGRGRLGFPRRTCKACDGSGLVMR